MATGTDDKHNYSNIFNQTIWFEECRADILSYFKSRELVCQRVPTSPIWSQAPFSAIWAISGVGIPGFQGWYVIIGDHPTDVVGMGNLNGATEVLEHFATKWSVLALTLLEGKPVSDFRIPVGGDLERYGRSIADRADKLAVIAERLRRTGQ